MPADQFLSRLGQAEARDSARMVAQANGRPGANKANGSRPGANQAGNLQRSARQHVQQQHMQVDHAVRRQQREIGVVQTRMMPADQRPGWSIEPSARNKRLLGREPAQDSYLSPQAQRIQRMLASTGGAKTNPFYASETSKFNASQPHARRNQESSIAFGTPSPEEQARYLEYMMS